MSFFKIKSYAKLNLSLNVIKKIPKKNHLIESLITFVELHDLIHIRQIKSQKHIIRFAGKFSKNINKNNTVQKLFNLLDEKKLLNGKKFEIKIIKNIPQKSGMAGGSINASRIMKFFLSKKIINDNENSANNIMKSIGSDVPLGLNIQNLILSKNNKVKKIKKKLKLYTLLVKPNFGCSTKKIYFHNKIRSYPNYKNPKVSLFSIKNLIKSKNDLEIAAFKLYPKLKNIKLFLYTMPDVIFVRMTGSGSCIVAYYQTKKKALKGLKLFKKKYKSYWCIVSKTI